MTQKRKTNKRMMSIKVSNEFYKEFDEFCKEFGFTKSGFIERATKKLMNELKTKGIESARV